jgi:hypothetical protein
MVWSWCLAFFKLKTALRCWTPLLTTIASLLYSLKNLQLCKKALYYLAYVSQRGAKFYVMSKSKNVKLQNVDKITENVDISKIL